MKIITYKLISFLLLVLTWNSLFAQTISGPTEVCPNNIINGSYSLSSGSCNTISNITWSLNSPNASIYLGTNPVNISWSASAGAGDNVTLTATYNCTTTDSNGDPVVTSNTATLDIAILVINEPIITSSSTVNLVCNETDPFVITIAGQPGPAAYSVTHPDCFSYSYANNQFTFTPDGAAYGEICITINQSSCATSKTECITVARACEDNLVFSSTASITNNYHSVNNYITASNASTTSFPNLEFKAGKAITLQPGFSVGSVFLAHIGPCSCLPDGSIGCLHERAAQSTSLSSSTRGSRGRLQINSNQTQKSSITSAESISSIFTVYPNPSKGLFTLHFDVMPSNATIQIFDVMGRLRKSMVVTQNQQTINASELENGVYIIVVSDQEQSFKEKIVIAK